MHPACDEPPQHESVRLDGAGAAQRGPAACCHVCHPGCSKVRHLLCWFQSCIPAGVPAFHGDLHCREQAECKLPYWPCSPSLALCSSACHLRSCPLSAYFFASCIHAMAALLQGRQYPVSVYYTAAPEESYLDAALATVMQASRPPMLLAFWHLHNAVCGTTRSRSKRLLRRSTPRRHPATSWSSSRARTRSSPWHALSAHGALLCMC